MTMGEEVLQINKDANLIVKELKTTGNVLRSQGRRKMFVTLNVKTVLL